MFDERMQKLLSCNLDNTGIFVILLQKIDPQTGLNTLSFSVMDE